MSNTYSLTITSIDCLPTYQDQTQVVYNLNWKLSGTDGVNTNGTQGTQLIVFDANTPFTPFESLTEEQVLGWLNSAEPFASSIATFKSDIDNNLLSMNVTSVTPPWSA